MISNSLAGLLEHFGRNMPRMHFAQHAEKLSAAQLDKIKAALGRSMKHAQEWELDADGWDCITTGLRATYRRARRALRHARTDRATEDLHEWRKQTKYLWHQLQILTPLATGAIGELADEFHHLADYLGDEHDLAVLRERAGSVERAAPADRSPSRRAAGQGADAGRAAVLRKIAGIRPSARTALVLN